MTDDPVINHKSILLRSEGLNIVASKFFMEKEDCRGKIAISKIWHHLAVEMGAHLI